MKIELSPTARFQLSQLDAYLFERSPAGAERVVNQIIDLIELLERYPLIGHPGRVEGTRELVVPETDYVIAYRIVKDTIQVLAILHGAQRWPRQFDTRM